MSWMQCSQQTISALIVLRRMLCVDLSSASFEACRERVEGHLKNSFRKVQRSLSICNAISTQHISGTLPAKGVRKYDLMLLSWALRWARSCRSCRKLHLRKAPRLVRMVSCTFLPSAPTTVERRICSGDAINSLTTSRRPGYIIISHP